MATHDYVIANQNGANFRSDLNNVLQAIISNNSSATEPSNTSAYMWWADTANDKLKMRNGADSAWIDVMQISTGNPLFTGDLNLGDGDKINFGNANDLQIYHDGANSRIDDTGIGGLIIRGNASVNIGKYTGETMAQFNADGAVNLFYDNAEKLATTSTGIDVGTTTTSNNNVIIKSANNSKASVKYLGDASATVGWESGYDGSSNLYYFTHTNGTNAMNIDASGNLLVGKTSADATAGGSAGVEFRPDGQVQATRSGNNAGMFSRRDSDGDIVLFRKDTTTVGSIGNNGVVSYFVFYNSGNVALKGSANAVAPAFNTGAGRDNAIDLGTTGARFDDIYATNGTIQTSDQNEKQQIASLTNAEMNVAKRLSALFKTFKWNSSVEENGDNARTHTGIIAQDMQQAFTDEGLDAGNYAMFISSTWWETSTDVPAVESVAYQEATYDEDGNELTPEVQEVEGVKAHTRIDTFDTQEEAPEGATERTRLGVRYPELFAFINAYNDQRFADLEARITALEA